MLPHVSVTNGRVRPVTTAVTHNTSGVTLLYSTDGYDDVISQPYLRSAGRRVSAPGYVGCSLPRRTGRTHGHDNQGEASPRPHQDIASTQWDRAGANRAITRASSPAQRHPPLRRQAGLPSWPGCNDWLRLASRRRDRPGRSRE